MVTINESAKWCSKVIRSFACFYLLTGNKVGLYMLPPHSLFVTFLLSTMAFPLWQRKTWFSKFAKHSRGFDGWHRTEKYSFLSPTSCIAWTEQSNTAQIRYRVSKTKAKHWKRKKHAVVPFNKFARRSFCTGFRPIISRLQFAFYHFGNVVRRVLLLSHKIQQRRTYSKFVTMNFHDQLIRSLIITWDFISIDLCLLSFPSTRSQWVLLRTHVCLQSMAWWSIHLANASQKRDKNA